MRKKVFLETDEYDIFMFPVPESVLKGKKLFATVFPRKSVKEWVVSWMQRLHPCFDGRFLSDIKFYREKDRVMALVTVAEKMKIAPRLVKKNTAVYVYRPDKRRVFAGNVSGRRFWLASAFTAALVMAVLSGFAFYSDSRIVEEPDKQADVSSPHDAALEPVVVVQPPSCELVSGEPLSGEPAENGASSDEVVADEPVSGESAENGVSSDEAVVANPVSRERPADEPVSREQLTDELFPDEFAQSAKSAQSVPVPDGQCGFSGSPEFSDTTSICVTPSIYDTPFIDEFISALKEGGCRISSFRWQTEPCASAVLSVEGCFPEEIYDCAVKLCGDLEAPENENLPRLSFSSVNYVDNVPSFSVLLDYSKFETATMEMGAGLPSSENMQTVSATEATKEKPAYKNAVLPAQSAFRKLIVNAGGHVYAESFAPPGVSGAIPCESWNTFSEDVSNLLSSQAVGGVSCVTFESLPTNDVSVSISFDSDQTSFFPLELVSVVFSETSEQKDAPAFAEISAESQMVQQSASASENLLAQQSAQKYATQHDIPFVSMCQIGSVCMGGNVYVKFYRDYDGKIFKGEPYEKN